MIGFLLISWLFLKQLLVAEAPWASTAKNLLIKTQKLRGGPSTMDILGITLDLLQEPVTDAIVVGSGLAGMTAALTILDRGGTVMVIEKEGILGGNSNKASSGMNACCLKEEIRHSNDTLAMFFEDTVRSAGDVANTDLIDTLISNSVNALQWIKDRVGVDLSDLVQLGGHSRKRTHRPSNGFVGAEIMNAMENAIRSYSRKARILTDTSVSQILHNPKDGQVVGIATQSRYGEYRTFRSDHVILATGGFASDRSHGSFLQKYRPDLLRMAATAGAFSTGDGITLAESLGAATRDMEKVQIHPTGFVDPTDPRNPNKVLAAELLRGVGGMLIDSSGKRFCNELGTRAYVTDKMLEHDPVYGRTRKWDSKERIPTFHLVLSLEAAENAKSHITMYVRKGLMTVVEGVNSLAETIDVPVDILTASLQEYQRSSMTGTDEFGKTYFPCVPMVDLTQELFYVGLVTPAMHYCMGGLMIDTFGNVLRNGGQPIPGLHAAGEVTGGVHGNNRLGGNSLLECAVYGLIVGQDIPIRKIDSKDDNDDHTDLSRGETEKMDSKILNGISYEELSKHNTTKDCWVALHGKVYDLTQFASHHPGGSQSILSLAGKDGTSLFSLVHSVNILNRVDHLVGFLETWEVEDKQQNAYVTIMPEELRLHAKSQDCWVVLFGTVYDLTEFGKYHPGGSYIIQKLAGKDGTKNYQAFHPQEKLKTIQATAVGRLVGYQ